MEKTDLGKEKISKLLISFAIPCVISMLINSVYNIVDQIFIGQGVGTLGNAATNVIFPLVIIFNAIALLIGNGCAAGLSLKLGEGDAKEASKYVGSSITLLTISSVIISIISYILLPKLVYLFGCSPDVYQYAIDYGRIIILGAPFMIIYSGLAAIIRADGAPKYSMMLLVVGAIINLVLDPLFIFTFNMGVKGGALATIIGQVISCIIAVIYIRKIKSVTIKKEDYKIDKDIFKILGLGTSTFITQMTILALFVFMNNIMTKYGALTKFGANIPLSVYGVISKLNGMFVSFVIGIAVGAQPIIGFNYGAQNYKRVKETLKDILIINSVIGIIFNIMFFFFSKPLVSMFIASSDPNYELFMEFATLICKTFLMVCALNILEMTTSVVVQSLGNVKKATAVSFIRQIVLFIPISLILCIGMNKGIYGVLYAGPIADILSFIVCIKIFSSEYNKIKLNEKMLKEFEIQQEIESRPDDILHNKVIEEIFKEQKSDYETDENEADEDSTKNNSKSNLQVMDRDNITNKQEQELNKDFVITISREYGSGGKYVGKILSEMLNVKFYDKELIEIASNKSGYTKEYIEENEQIKKEYGENYNNDDNIFIAESKAIEDIAKKPCVIVGRCADYVLREKENVFKVYIYSDSIGKVNRAVKYYGLEEKTALIKINKINRAREKHYNYYTGRKWKDFSNYDIAINTDSLGIELAANVIKEMAIKKFNKED